MPRLFPQDIRNVVLVLLIVGVSGWLAQATACAGWIVYRNEMTETVVLQQVTVVNNQIRRCPPVKLLPNEQARVSTTGPCARKVLLFDPKQPNQPIFQADLPPNIETLSLAIQKESGMIKLVPIALPSPASPTPKR